MQVLGVAPKSDISIELKEERGAVGLTGAIGISDVLEWSDVWVCVCDSYPVPI